VIPFSKHALTYYRAYDASNARWLSRDPIGELSDINVYDYVRDNPLRLVDPYGLAYGDWWDPRSYFNDGWLRFYYTGNANSSDEVFEGSTEAA
jgi:uncharacterized protein RhaS with RHS repeats